MSPIHHTRANTFDNEIYHRSKTRDEPSMRRVFEDIISGSAICLTNDSFHAAPFCAFRRLAAHYLHTRECGRGRGAQNLILLLSANRNRSLTQRLLNREREREIYSSRLASEKVYRRKETSFSRATVALRKKVVLLVSKAFRMIIFRAYIGLILEVARFKRIFRLR